MLTTLVFLLILMSAVMVHELAHYLNARSVGVPVRAFSIGMGPVVWRRHWRGTEWRLSLLPLGGYVDLPGMAPKVGEDGELLHADEGMATKTLPEKLWVLVGGVIANFALGVLLIAAATLLEPNTRALTNNLPIEELGAVIGAVVEGSTAEEIGLRAGDRIVSIGGVEDPNPTQVVNAIRAADVTLSLTVERDGERREFSTPWPPPGAGERPLLGVQVGPAEITSLEPVSPLLALGEATAFGVRILPQMVRGFINGFGSALIGRQSEEVAGPVGIVRSVGQATQLGLPSVLLLAAIINLSLAVFNLLPIPGLDGGRMLLATVVALRGRPFRPGQEETIHFLGIMAVLALIVLITFNELSGLIRS